MKFDIKKINNGQIPTRKHKSDVGYDCYSNVSALVKAGETVKIPLGFAVGLTERIEVQLRPRSGLNSKGIFAQFGTIDSGYTGEVSAVLYNSTKEDFQVSVGDRVCQIVFNQVCLPDFNEVDELSETDRGESGFGSTGV